MNTMLASSLLLACAWLILSQATVIAVHSQLSQAAARSLLDNQKPPTCRDRYSTEVVANYTYGVQPENLVVKPDNTLYVTSINEGVIYHIRAPPSGQSSLFAKVGKRVNGIAEMPDKKSLVTVGADADDQAAIWKVSPNGNVTLIVAIVGAEYLNGITRFQGDKYLVTDSGKGAIWIVDVVKRTVKIWIQHKLLQAAEVDSVGVDGVKIFKQNVYVSNLDTDSIVRIAIGKKLKAGKVEVYAKNVGIDDFAFDTNGNIWAAGVKDNKLTLITPSQKVSYIYIPNVLVPTAVAFGRSGTYINKIFITTFSSTRGLQAGSVMVINVCARGQPLL